MPSASTLVIALSLCAAGCEAPSDPEPPPAEVRSPIVTGIRPAAGPLAGGTAVTINGGNFIEVTEVRVGEAELASVSVVSDTELTGITTAAAVVGTVDVSVLSSSHGLGACVLCFTYNPPPRIQSVTPGSAPLRGGTLLQIEGSGFVDVVGVEVGGTDLVQLSVHDSTRVSGVTASFAAPGNHDLVLVSTSRGTATCENCVVSRAAGAVSISAGQWHTCGLTDEGAIHCWGQGTAGQLGNGQAGNSAVPVRTAATQQFVRVSTGNAHTCALSAAGAAYCWGSMSPLYPLGPDPVTIGGDLQLYEVKSGNAHACGLTADSLAYCWGLGIDGQLGNASRSDSEVPVPVAGDLRFASLTGGDGHTCAVTGGGAGYCWGDNSLGQLGTASDSGTSTPAPVDGPLVFRSMATGYLHTCGVTQDGSAYCWGSNVHGQLGDGSYSPMTATPTRVAAEAAFTVIATGEGHTCALDTGGAAYCWGSDQYGQLGNGAAGSVPTPVPVVGGQSFTAITAGRVHTCGLTASGAYCWGYNEYGQIGDTTTSGTPDPSAVRHWP